MPLSTLERFTRFSTDAAGIERMLRMGQALLAVAASQPLLANGFSRLVELGNHHIWTESRAAGVWVLHDLKARLALARRFLRMFHFLAAFDSAHQLYASIYTKPPAAKSTPSTWAPAAATNDDGARAGRQANTDAQNHNRYAAPHLHRRQTHETGPPAEAWLDIFGRTFNGMYLLIESITLVDALQLPGFSLWGRRWFPILQVEGQRFWFIALTCGFASGLVKIAKLFAHAPVPPTGEGYGMGEKMDESQMADWKEERERLRRIIRARKEQRQRWKATITGRLPALVRRCVADVLDLAVPGSVVGWVNAKPGTVGAIMVVTTYLTGVDVWERC